MCLFCILFSFSGFPLLVEPVCGKHTNPVAPIIRRKAEFLHQFVVVHPVGLRDDRLIAPNAHAVGDDNLVVEECDCGFIVPQRSRSTGWRYPPSRPVSTASGSIYVVSSKDSRFPWCCQVSPSSLLIAHISRWRYRPIMYFQRDPGSRPPADRQSWGCV